MYAHVCVQVNVCTLRGSVTLPDYPETVHSLNLELVWQQANPAIALPLCPQCRGNRYTHGHTSFFMCAWV